MSIERIPYTPGPWHFDRRGQLRNAAGESLASFPIDPGCGIGAPEDLANLRAVAATPEIIGAARRLLGRLDEIGTLQFAQGAELAERDALRAVLQAAVGGPLEEVALTPETPAATYPQTPGTVGDMARILERAARLPLKQRMLFAHTLESLVAAAERLALEAANAAGDG